MTVTSAPVAQGGQTISFTCGNCGATTNAVALGTSIRCPFCGSEHVITAAVAPDLPSIELIVPFEIPDNQVDGLYRQWLGQGFFPAPRHQRKGDQSPNARGLRADLELQRFRPEQLVGFGGVQPAATGGVHPD